MTVEDFDNNQVKFYMPNSSNADSLFVYDDMYLFIKFNIISGSVDDPKTLKIGNQVVQF